MPILASASVVDDERRDDLDEAGRGEGRAQARLELDELRRAAGGAQLLQAAPAAAHQVVLELLERRVAGGGVGELAVQHERVGAELAQALRLRRREAHAERLGVVGGHGSLALQRRPGQVVGETADQRLSQRLDVVGTRRQALVRRGC